MFIVCAISYEMNKNQLANKYASQKTTAICLLCPYFLPHFSINIILLILLFFFFYQSKKIKIVVQPLSFDFYS